MSISSDVLLYVQVPLPIYRPSEADRTNGDGDCSVRLWLSRADQTNLKLSYFQTTDALVIIITTRKNSPHETLSPSLTSCLAIVRAILTCSSVHLYCEVYLMTRISNATFVFFSRFPRISFHCIIL